MIQETLESIKNKVQLRANLIQMKEFLREDQKGSTHHREELLSLVEDADSLWKMLLQEEDAKVRKNTALILGELCLPRYLPMLYEAYTREQQQFVKSAYLIAMQNYDYNRYQLPLTQRMNELSCADEENNNQKHHSEELRELTKMLLSKEEKRFHTFSGWKVASDIILLTNRNHIHLTMEQLTNVPKKEFSAGIMLKSKDLQPLLLIRTYTELLFVLPKVKIVQGTATEIARELLYGGLVEFLEQRHIEKEPFYFRIELKSRQKSSMGDFVKCLGITLQKNSNQRLINSASHYEVELRLVENHEGSYNVLLKLFTLKDHRFDYRRESIAASIRPVNAALTFALAQPYLTENAQVLDPFCGVGTMLMERKRALPTGSLYGLDLFGEAIEKARNNTSKEDGNLYFIHRDFFDFTHEYLFDEIVTNLPFVRQSFESSELKKLYLRFFQKAGKHLKENGRMILYTHNRELVKENSNANGFMIEKEYEISMKEGTYVCILKYTKIPASI